MADFFDGKNIQRSVNTPDGIMAGWLPINGALAVPVPNCEEKYWKIVDGEIVEMTAEEKTAIDTPIEPVPTPEDYFNNIMAGLTEIEQMDFLDVYDEFPTFGLMLRNGNPEMAKSRLDAAEGAGMLTEAQSNKIKGLIDGT